MPMTEKAFRKLALEDPSAHWELHDGVPRQKPGMTAKHNDVGVYLVVALANQLDRNRFRVRFNAGHVRRSSDRYYIPDVMVIPIELYTPQEDSRQLEVYQSPLALVVEIWSPSTGAYDVESKLPEYERRGDLEIWLLHPYDRSLRVWRHQPDGTYTESSQVGGVISPVGLPGVSIDLDALYE